MQYAFSGHEFPIAKMKIIFSIFQNYCEENAIIFFLRY